MRAKPMWKLLCALLMATQLLWVGGAAAQAPPQDPSQFDLTGFIQAATLDPTCATNVLCGGTITVNNQLITVPKNTILQMPALALTWQQVFAQAPAAYLALGQSGLAMTDGAPLAVPPVPAPLRTYEVHVQGNRLGNTYIAGLLFIAQSSLQSGQGFINAIDLTTGMFEVGGQIGVLGTGQRVLINDPAGKFGRASNPLVIDPRFTIDEGNPTVRSATGYPMCIPRNAADASCPQSNRPADPTSVTGFAMVFQFPAIANVVAGGLDPQLMAPFEVGDYVTYSGILVNDPAPATTTYIAAYQVIGDVGLFTAPGDPAYVATDVMLLGTGGQTVAGLVEATARTRFEGFTTDASRNILLWGIDVDPCTGAQTPRNWGSIDVDQGPPKGVVLGRWRFRPPGKVLTMPAGGGFVPPTREMRATIETALGSGIAATPFLMKNGLLANQYQAPIFTFLFPENVNIGSPMVPNNFESLLFLLNGSGPLDPTQAVSATNPIVGQLNPWPLGFTAPPAPLVCAPAPPPGPPPSATITISPSSTVLQKTLVTLDASASTGAAPLSFTWTAPAGVTLSSAIGAKVTFIAPGFNVDTTLSITVTVRDAAGQTSTAIAKVLVKASSFSPLAPVAKVVILPSATVFSGTNVILDASGSTDPNGLALSFQWSGPNPPTLSPSRTAAKVSFFAPVVAAQTTYNFSVNVSNGPKTSTVSNIVVTVKPATDTITFVAVTYRTGLRRLIVDATDSNPAAVLTMQAWADAAETTPIGPPLTMIFNPAGVPPAPEAILVGFGQPDHVTVTSSVGAVARSPILLLRQ